MAKINYLEGKRLLLNSYFYRKLLKKGSSHIRVEVHWSNNTIVAAAPPPPPPPVCLHWAAAWSQIACPPPLPQRPVDYVLKRSADNNYLSRLALLKAAPVWNCSRGGPPTLSAVLCTSSLWALPLNSDPSPRPSVETSTGIYHPAYCRHTTTATNTHRPSMRRTHTTVKMS